MLLQSQACNLGSPLCEQTILPPNPHTFLSVIECSLLGLQYCLVAVWTLFGGAVPISQTKKWRIDRVCFFRMCSSCFPTYLEFCSQQPNSCSSGFMVKRNMHKNWLMPLKHPMQWNLDLGYFKQGGETNPRIPSSLIRHGFGLLCSALICPDCIWTKDSTALPRKILLSFWAEQKSSVCKKFAWQFIATSKLLSLGPTKKWLIIYSTSIETQVKETHVEEFPQVTFFVPKDVHKVCETIDLFAQFFGTLLSSPSGNCFDVSTYNGVHLPSHVRKERFFSAIINHNWSSATIIWNSTSYPNEWVAVVRRRKETN